MPSFPAGFDEYYYLTGFFSGWVTDAARSPGLGKLEYGWKV